MMSNLEGNISGPARFEVGMPNPTPDQRNALSALAIVFGWEVREAVEGNDALLGVTDLALPKSSVVGEAEFVRASLDLWKSDIYGRTASTVIQNVRSGYSSTLRRSDYSPMIQHSLGQDYAWGRSLPSSTGDNERDVAVVREALEALSPPFDVVSVVASKGISGYIIGEVQAGVLRRDKLAGYLLAKGLSGHALHGTLGKSLDVLKTIADQDISESSGLYAPDDFVQIAELMRVAQGEGLKPATIRTLSEKVRDTLFDQLATGQPAWHGEIVVEGLFNAASRWDIKQIRDLSIAKDSLQALAFMIKRRSSPIRGFLQDYYRNNA